MEEISLGYRSKENRQRRGGGSAAKILVGKDLLKELEQRRSSPSVIAKLMGIDVLPPPQVALNQHQEFKDVFEVSEPLEVMKERSRQVGKGLPSLKRSRLKLKKLVPAKSPSSDETFDGNVEWRDGLDRLNSLERDNPLFEKRPHDVKYSPNHWQQNHIAVLKAEDGSKYGRNEFRAFGREKDAVNAFRKHPVGLAHSSLRELTSPLHHDEARRRGNCDNLSSIVVLEPSLERAGNPENIFSSSYISDIDKICRREKEHRQCESCVLHKGRVSRHLLDNEDVSVPRGPREIYWESNAVEKVKLSPDQHLKDKNSFAQFGMNDMNSSGSSQRYSNYGCNFMECNRIPSDSFSRKLSRQYEDIDSGSKSLAEMFALSDSERSKRSSHARNRVRRDKLDSDSDHNKEGCFIVLPKYAPYSYPSPMHSHNSWDRNTVGSNDDQYMLKDMMNLRAANSSQEGSPQSGNFPKTSLNYNNGKLQPYLFRDGLRLLKQKTNTSQENLMNIVVIKRPAAEKPKVVFPSHDDTRSDSWRLAENFSAPDCMNEKVLFTTDEGLVRKPPSSASLAKDLKFSEEERKVTSPLQYQEDESVTHSDHAGGKSLKGSKEAEQPSPVSILEPPTDEDSYCSGYFKYDMEDVHDLQKQIDDNLELLEETEVYTSSDDDSRDESLEAFRVEEDRDFSYLLDILINSGVIVANLELLCKAWHSPGCPVGPHVFDKLERKYNKIGTWARPERKLLFDLVNCVLSEVLAPCIDTHPWVKSSVRIRPIWGPEGPVEKVWQMLVRQREELAVGQNPDDKVLDPKWLEIGNDINMMGKQIGRMLHDDLLEEVILEFLSGSTASRRQ